MPKQLYLSFSTNSATNVNIIANFPYRKIQMVLLNVLALLVFTVQPGNLPSYSVGQIQHRTPNCEQNLQNLWFNFPKKNVKKSEWVGHLYYIHLFEDILGLCGATGCFPLLFESSDLIRRRIIYLCMLNSYRT